MGKRKSQIWQHFVSFKVSGHVHGKCKYCKNASYQNNASRMEKHLKNCAAVPSVTRDAYFGPPSKKISKELATPITLDSSSDSDSDCVELPDATQLLVDTSSISIPNLKQRCSSTLSAASASTSTNESIISHFDVMSKVENQRLNELFAKAVYATASPFSMVTNPFWSDFFQQLRPSWRKPSPYMLKGPLLDIWDVNVSEQNDRDLKNAAATVLMTDGWSCISGDSHIQFLASTPSPVFLCSVHPETNRHTAEYIAAECKKVIESMATLPVALVTDHASNMLRAWKLLKTDFPGIHTYGCGAHAIELLASDFLKIDSLAMAKLKMQQISKFFRRHQIPKAVLKEVQTTKVPVTCLLSVPTRWSSSFEMMKRNVRLQNFIRIAISDGRTNSEVRKNPHIKDLCFDTDVLWPSTEFTVKLLLPVRNAIKEVEGNLVRVSVLPRIWNYIQVTTENTIQQEDCPLADGEAELLRSAVKERREFSVRAPQMAANLLDPRFCGNDLDESEQGEAMKEVVSIADKLGVAKDLILTDLIAFRSRDGPVYGNEFYWSAVQNETDPLQWWKTFCNKRPLAPIAMEILSLPASVACVERSNKEFGLQKTKKRNRLTDERSAKLTKVSYNVKVRHFANQRKEAPKQHLALTVPESVVGLTTVDLDAEEVDETREVEDGDVDLDAGGEDETDYDDDDDDEDVVEVEEFEVGNWVAVEYVVQDGQRERVRLFYGLVEGICAQSERLTVKFLKKILVSRYQFPDQDEIDVVHKSLCTKVKDPEVAAASARRKPFYSFCEKEREMLMKNLLK